MLLAMHGGDWALNNATGNTGNSRITKGYDRLNEQLKRPLGAINRGIDNSTDFLAARTPKQPIGWVRLAETCC